MFDSIARELAASFRSLVLYIFIAGIIFGAVLGGLGYGIYYLWHHVSFVWH